jgi:hypothetical protein
MLVGTAVAIFLLVRPPGQSKGAAPVVVGRVTATVEAGGGAGTGTPVAQETSSAATSVPSDTTPGADGTADAVDTTPEPEATPAAEPTTDVAFREYVVVEGDSLFGIAEQTIAPGDDIALYVEAIANLNGWTVDTAELIPGETILLPPLPE